jgi:hypothetical protein
MHIIAGMLLAIRRRTTDGAKLRANVRMDGMESKEPNGTRYR